MSGYKLRLFGGFDLRDDQGSAIAIRSKKGRCLLAYLALAQGQQTNREILAALLWGDRGEAQARGSLSQELYRLRGLFPEQVQAGFDLSTDSVAIAPDLLDIDVVRFERGVASGEPGAVAEAAALYAGELLAGLSAGSEGFDGWLRDARERLRERAITAWRDVVRAGMDGPAEGAIESASRLLALDASNEEAHRALMRLYAKTGRRDLALRQYEKCKKTLAAELDIEPDASTRELHEKISAATPDASDNVPGHAAATHDQPLPLPSKPSIAVLPFDNMSDDVQQEYFSGGIADDIITELSRFRDLFVIARNSSFTYRGSAVDNKQVGRELGVRYILEGGVRKAGNRVRITAQLIEAESGNHLWAEKYDGDLADIFDLQDEITASVVGVIQPTLFVAEVERARRKRVENLDAYEHQLRGWAAYYRLTPEGLTEALDHAQAALKADAGYGRAYALLAWVNFFRNIFVSTGDRQAEMRAATTAAQRAVELDDADAQAHGILAITLAFGREYDTAIAEAERALRVNPNLAWAVFSHALVSAFTGQYEVGATQCKHALRLSPRDPVTFVFLPILSVCHYALGEYEASVESASRLVALRPDYLLGHWHIAIASAQLGQMDRARRAFAEILRINPNFDRAYIETMAPFQDRGELEHELDGFRKAGLKG